MDRTGHRIGRVRHLLAHQGGDKMSKYPYEYEHKIENDDGTTTVILYLFNIKLLSDFSATSQRSEHPSGKCKT